MQTLVHQIALVIFRAWPIQIHTLVRQLASLVVLEHLGLSGLKLKHFKTM